MSILNDSDLAPVLELLKKDFSGWFKSNEGGPYLQQLEREFARFLTARHAIAVSSGSASLYIALKACEVGPGDEVAVPAYTHVGTVAPIVLAGAKPVFVDVNEHGNMDPEDLRKVASVVRVKAVIVVHQLGLPCEMDRIRESCNGAFIVEDASHSLGAEYKGTKAGVLGNIGCFSIGGGRTKTIGTGEGGIIAVNDEQLAERCKNMRNHGDRVTDVDYFCFNFRMSELNALVGLLQMPKLQFMIDWQIRNAEYMIARLPSCLETIAYPSNVKAVHYIVGCHFSSKEADMSRDDLLRKVRDRGFEGGAPRKNVGKGYSKLISDVKFYTRFRRDLPMSEKIRDDAVWIDWHRYPRTKEEIDQLVNSLDGICS
jgi:perosamine synthetase